MMNRCGERPTPLPRAGACVRLCLLLAASLTGCSNVSTPPTPGPSTGAQLPGPDTYLNAAEPHTAGNGEPSTPAALVQRAKNFVRADRDNALPHYLLATAHAREDAWASVLDELRIGNKAARCTTYRPTGDPFVSGIIGPIGPLVSHLQRGEKLINNREWLMLLTELRVTAKRVAAIEPASGAGILLAARIRLGVGPLLPRALRKTGQPAEAAAAERKQNADLKWWQWVRKELAELTGTGLSSARIKSLRNMDELSQLNREVDLPFALEAARRLPE